MVKMASSKARGEREPETSLWRELKAGITPPILIWHQPSFSLAGGQTGFPTRPQASHNRKRTLWVR